MAVKIPQLPSVPIPSMADLKEISQEGSSYNESNLDVYTLFQPGATGIITTSTTLEGPLPGTIFLNMSGADQIITLMPLTAANHACLGRPIRFVNMGNFTVQLRYSDGSALPGSDVNANSIRDYSIITVGTPGVVLIS